MSVVAEYTQLLCCRKFEECIEKCSLYLDDLKRKDPSVQSRERRNVEDVLWIQIQALVELGLVRNVVSVVSGVYGSWEACPQRLAAACFAAHAANGNGSASEALAQAWLSRAGSVSREAICQFATVYQRHLAKDSVNTEELTAFLARLELPPEETDHILEHVRRVQQSAEALCQLEGELESADVSATDVSERQVSDAAAMKRSATTVLTDLGRRLLRLLSFLNQYLSRWRPLLVALALSLLLVIKYPVLADVSLRQGCQQLYELLQHGWRVAFAPYYKIKG